MSSPTTAVILNPKETLLRLEKIATLCNEYDQNNFLSDCDLAEAQKQGISSYIEVQKPDSSVVKYEKPFLLQRGFSALMLAKKDGLLGAPVTFSTKTTITEIEEDQANRTFYKVNPGCVRFDSTKWTPYGQGGSTGSGWVWKDLGGGKYIVLTNHHVVADMIAGQVTTWPVAPGHKPVKKIKVLGADPFLDVAVVQIETTEKLTVLKSGDSNQLQSGDIVYAVGNMMGLPPTFSRGDINNPKQYNGVIRTIQHSALIQPGNSGGPLFNKDGQVIGINTFMATYPNGTPVSGMGFAYPVNEVEKMAAAIIAGKTPSYGWLGVDLAPADPVYIDKNRKKYGSANVARLVDVGAGQVLQKDWLVHSVEVAGERLDLDPRDPDPAQSIFTFLAQKQPGLEIKMLVSYMGKEWIYGSEVEVREEKEVTMPLRVWYFH